VAGSLAYGESRDPLWDHFINRTPADPKDNLTPSLQGAPEGRIYPVKTEVADPQTMSQQIKGVGAVGWGRPGGRRGSAARPPATRRAVRGPYPFAVVCVIATDYDLRKPKGSEGSWQCKMGCRQPPPAQLHS
jgi:hypothetical protein